MLIKIDEENYVNPEYVESVRIDDDAPIVYVGFNDGTELYLPEFETRDEARKVAAEIADKLNAEETQHVED